MFPARRIPTRILGHMLAGYLTELSAFNDKWNITMYTSAQMNEDRLYKEGNNNTSWKASSSFPNCTWESTQEQNRIFQECGDLIWYINLCML